MEEIAAVYSRSLFAVAKDRGSLDQVREQLGQVADAVAANRDLQVFFFSPELTTREKQDGLVRMLDGADETLMSFLELLLEKHRMPVLMRIRRHFDALWERENKQLPVTITSAVALDAEVLEHIGKRIGERTASQVVLTAQVEPDILGGLVVRVGNSILDASVRNRIDDIHKQLARA